MKMTGLPWLAVALTPRNGESLLTVDFRAGAGEENHALSLPLPVSKLWHSDCWPVAKNSPGSPTTPWADSANVHRGRDVDKTRSQRWAVEELQEPQVQLQAIMAS